MPRAALALFAALILTLVFGATAARAQLTPFVDCVERVRNSDGTATNSYIAYFGYNSLEATAVTIPFNTPNNYFTPISNVPNAPSVFFPGVHSCVVAVTLTSLTTQETWVLSDGSATASFSASQLCGEDGANSRLITYQGRLSDGAVAANGTYDLRFQLFNAATGGTARTTPITLENVSVTNGVFTVQLDLGAASLPAGTPSNTTAVNLKLNPAILEAENSFFEIGVRAGISTGSDPFTTLAPRQPITAAPLAMRANTANTAFRATYADQGSGGFEVGGNARVNGNLTVTGSISGASKNFKIDHPLDPLNKYLNYTSIESPDMMNIYNGNATTNASGEAIVTMPDYFEALNKEFRYQLTVIGTFAQAIVAEKINGNQFKIRTDKPNVEVSWQVTGIRRDKFAEDNHQPVEQNKPDTEKGKCLYAPACRREQQR